MVVEKIASINCSELSSGGGGGGGSGSGSGANLFRHKADDVLAL